MTFKIRQQLCDIAKKLHTKNYLAGCDGNISYRIKDDYILITPKGKPKAHLHPDDFAVITLQGQVVIGEPSSEQIMHLTVYQNCPKAQCVVHAHPPTAIAWTIAHPHDAELPNDCMSELIIAAGRVPIAPYARPGSNMMGTVITTLLPTHRIIILARHGALTWGESHDEAYHAMERLEHSAEILMRAKLLGNLTRLPQDELQALYAIRSTIGEKVI